ncbi:MAG: DUF523 domain-containing protein [Planctomycetes bacterium]|nr:DUF523 domain-containing protein [Planctomycetota bacterium]
MSEQARRGEGEQAGPHRPPRPRVGVSACLLGRRVRHDGRHRLDPVVDAELGRVFAWVPVCPEVEAGLGTPREPMHLEGDPGSPRLVVTRTGEDLGPAFGRWAAVRLSALAHVGLSGFVLKRGSPSCGIDDPPGAGLFALALRRRFPDLPMEQEDRLADAKVRNEFIRRVRAHRLRVHTPIGTGPGADIG